MSNWIKDILDPKSREWEEFYRNRWQYDKVVRSTHGVNCTGGCSWNVFVKDGIITWELQATDYPLLDKTLPPYEPRGCQRGISASWYVYSPLRVKYPYIRGSLLTLWKRAKKKHKNPMEAWASIVEDEKSRKKYQKARGMGGFRRADWNTVLEIIAVSSLYTAKKYGPDRVFGFSPIPAMSYLSYGGGSRFLQLFGGVNLSFYDWYCDLPNAFPETWGEQTDVAESADWYNSRYIVSMGSNLSMTRTPDVHFISEAKNVGTKFVTIAPDFSMAAKFADWWIPIKQGHDAALWSAVNHVILKEYYVDKKVPYFIDYIKKYTDSPFLVELVKEGDNYAPGQFLRANKLEEYKDISNGDWKLLVVDEDSNELRVPTGTIGFRYGEDNAGKWNLLPNDMNGKPLNPLLSLIDTSKETAKVAFYEFGEKKEYVREVPVRKVKTVDGEKLVTTSLDLLFAHFGVGRGMKGDYPTDYNDESSYSPAWQEKFTGIGRDTVIKLAREFASNAERTEGKSMVITGAGVNHWYHQNLIYRSAITALILTGCVGKNGGGLNHYVGQEKLTLMTPWLSIALATDWGGPPRVQQAPLWHYINSDQFRYEGEFTDYYHLPEGRKYAKGHTADHIAKSVRNGWMPYYPQFSQNSLDLAKEAQEAGKTDDAGIKAYIAEKINKGEIDLSVEDPDAPENWPRVFLIWRGNALMSSAKGHEFFLKHYLGTSDNLIKDEEAGEYLKDVKWREDAPIGKFDLVVDINFRMDTSALYSDIVLPTAMWYEKNDLNSTDMHSFVHPLGAATPPAWEAKSDWDIFKEISKKISEISSEFFPEPVKDIVTKPLAHDSPDEITQPEIKDWKHDDGVDYIPGKTGFKLAVTERDYSKLYQKFISLGPNVRNNGLGAHGIRFPVDDIYDEMANEPTTRSPDPKHFRSVEWDGQRYPSLEDALDAANAILRFAPESNGELSFRAFEAMEKKTGLDNLTDLAEKYRSVRMTFEDLKTQPKRILTSPFWSGDVNEGRAYTGYALNVDKFIPWRTLTGRQSLYLDHPNYIDFKEQFPIFKPRLDMNLVGDLDNTDDSNAVALNYITPHGKWHIHSTYGDNLRMQALSRGCYPVWMHPDDAAKIGIEDNDWVEVINDNGVVVTRAIVSSRIPVGTAWIYHSPERTVSVPLSNERKKRGGGHNSLTRVKLNPMLLSGGYAQWSYGFNYWGPVGVNRDTFVLVKKLKNLEWE